MGNNVIDKIKTLISDYEDEQRILSNMSNTWDESGDSGCDPGLQYEQSNIVNEAYKNIINYVRNLPIKEN